MKITRNDLPKGKIYSMNQFYGLMFFEPYLNYRKIGYNAGINGHNYDAYRIFNIAITIGNSPIGKEIPFFTAKTFGLTAKAIKENRNLSEEDKKEHLETLLNILFELIKGE